VRVRKRELHIRNVAVAGYKIPENLINRTPPGRKIRP